MTAMMELDIILHIVEYSDYYCVNHVIFLPPLENDRRDESFPTVVKSPPNFWLVISRLLGEFHLDGDHPLECPRRADSVGVRIIHFY